MLETIETLLRETVPPERADLYLDSIALLERTGANHIQPMVEHWFQNLDDQSMDQAMDWLNDYLLGFVRERLREYGIQLTDESPQSLYGVILDGVLLLEDPPDRSPFLAILERELDPIQQYCALLGLALNQPDSRFEPYVMQVDTGVIESLYETYKTPRATIDPEQLNDLQEQKQRIQRFQLDDGSNPAQSLWEQGSRLGAPLDQLLTQHHETLLTLSGQANTALVCDALIGVLLLSSVPCESLETAFTQHIETYAGSINEITLHYQRFKRHQSRGLLC